MDASIWGKTMTGLKAGQVVFQAKYLAACEITYNMDCENIIQYNSTV